MPKQTFFNLAQPKQDHIIAAAMEEFAAKGYKQASVTQIVVAAGIAKGSFYQYFSDKDDLFCYVVTTQIGNRKKRAFMEGKSTLAELNLTEFLRLVFHRLVGEMSENPNLMRIGMDLLSLMHDPIYARIQEHYKSDLDTYFIPFIQYEMDQGEIDSKVNAHLLNYMLISLGQYLSALLLSGQAVTHNLLDKLVDDLDYILTNGIYEKAGG